jgi:NTE family protein
MKAFGIFEGGGAKGFAHIGALKAAEERRVKFIGVAGTSAGSIVAALIAAGYKADDLFDPASSQTVPGIFEKNFLEFLDSAGWANLQLLKSEGEELFNGSGSKSRFRLAKALKNTKPVRVFSQWKNIHLFGLRHRHILSEFWHERGFFTTAEFEKWLEGHLAAKITPNAATGKVAFENTLIPLAVIATDLTNQCIKVYSKEHTPKASVSSAVAASISIPFIFKPFHSDEDLQLVDGGLLSNFPAWVFDDERRRLEEFAPTFGFKLHKAINPDDVKPTTSLAFLNDLFSTALSGDSELEIRAIEDMSLIPLKVKASTLDFDIPFDKREDLYTYGKNSAHDFFYKYIGPFQPEVVLNILAVTRSHILQAMGKKKAHLRLNVAMPVGQKKDKLRILYPYNMNKDADDKLELGLNVGASGRCWQTHLPVVADLLAAKKVFDIEWKLNKYQQAMIRPTLKSLLCVPIFDQNKFDKDRAAEENPILGIVTVDSDDDLIEDFSKVAAQQAMADGAKLIASQLQHV